MNSNARSILLCVMAISLSSGVVVRSQEDKDTSDADLSKLMEMANKMQKEAADMQKTNPPASMGKKKSMAELQAMAKQEAAEMEQKEKVQKQKMAAALKKQVDAPGPVTLPDWTPKLPEMKADGPAARKIVDDQVYITVTGTSALTPAQLGDEWEKQKTDKTTIGRSNNTFNDLKQVIIYVHPQDSFDQEVRMEAERKGAEKVTRVKVSSPLPKPEVEDE